MTDPFSQADDFFGGGNPSISFKGDANRSVWKGGLITRIGDKQQQKDYKTKLPEFWDEAKTQPKWVLPVDVQTNERDPQDPHDDGMRSLWISGGVQRAIGAALKATRSKLRPGGTIYVMWASGAGEDGDPKQYEAQYTPPTPGAAAADAMFDQQQHQAPQHHQPAPQQHYAPPAAAPQYAPPAAPQQWQQPPAPPAAPQYAPPAPAPAQGAMWGQPAAPPAQQWPAPPQAAPAPAGPPAQPPVPHQVAPAPQLDPTAIEAAYAHLPEAQRNAIRASPGMTVEQLAAIYGPPYGQQPAA